MLEAMSMSEPRDEKNVKGPRMRLKDDGGWLHVALVSPSLRDLEQVVMLLNLSVGMLGKWIEE